MGDGPHAVILAAGQGKRMRSALPKVLHPVGGRPLILSVIDAATEATGTTPILVIASGDIAVRETVGDGATCVEQEAPRGTGDAREASPNRCAILDRSWSSTATRRSSGPRRSSAS